MQVKDKNILYPVAQIFVNLTNSHEKKEIEPELIELAKFSKQHVPEEHEKVSGDLLIYFILEVLVPVPPVFFSLPPKFT